MIDMIGITSDAAAASPSSFIHLQSRQVFGAREGWQSSPSAISSLTEASPMQMNMLRQVVLREICRSCVEQSASMADIRHDTLSSMLSGGNRSLQDSLLPVDDHWDEKGVVRRRMAAAWKRWKLVLMMLRERRKLVMNVLRCRQLVRRKQ